jgi:hypothetical protein
VNTQEWRGSISFIGPDNAIGQILAQSHLNRDRAGIGTGGPTRRCLAVPRWPPDRRHAR